MGLVTAQSTIHQALMIRPLSKPTPWFWRFTPWDDSSFHLRFQRPIGGTYLQDILKYLEIDSLIPSKHNDTRPMYPVTTTTTTYGYRVAIQNRYIHDSSIGESLCLGSSIVYDEQWYDYDNVWVSGQCACHKRSMERCTTSGAVSLRKMTCMYEG